MGENQPKIKVLETIRQGKVGGGESHVLDLVKNIDKNKFDPIVLSFTDGPMVETLKKMGITTHVIETIKPFNLSTFSKVRRLLIDEKIQLVHAHGTRAFSNVIFAAKSLGLPIVYTVHGWSFHQDQKTFERILRETSENFLTRNAALTICVSHSNRKDGINRFNMKRSMVINLGIDFDKFNPDNTFPDITSELQLDKGKTIVGFLVRMTKQKDPFTLIRAIAEVKKQTNQIQFLFVGDGDLKEEALQLAKDLGVMDLIKFHPFRSDVPNVLHNFDIYVLPSLWEGLPLGLLEAMAMKKAIVATPVDGTKEAITNEENGILVPCKDTKALAEAIIRLHNDKELRNKLAKSAQESVKQNFEIIRMVKQNEAAYLDILKAKN
jgi:glycosyltransferase involved in cell wall biosynthesis